MDPVLRLDVDGHTATITIVNPDHRNAMTIAMWRELPILLSAAARDERVRVLVLTGAGDTFSAGADLLNVDQLLQSGDTVAAEEALATLPKPTIARIRGHCVGGGCQLAVACDLRIAAEDARFGVPPARLGIVYTVETTRRLVALVGPATAKFLLYTADLVDAPRASPAGLTDEVVPVDELDTRVKVLADTIASRSALTIAAAKEIVDLAASGVEAPERAAYWLSEMRRSGEAAEGVAAFVERRPPRFEWVP
ncbi:MAG TPA: enoyl-CoA hydratase-related protein [Asanoa sp.]